MLFALHLPSHTLNPETTVATTLLCLVAAVVLLSRKSWSVSRPSVALFAAVTAFVFAVQMVNFPLLDGVTSGHLLGSAVAAILLGPVFGCASLTLVLIVQALALGDGGVSALGANVLNMGLASPLAAYAAYSLARRERTGTLATLGAALAAGWAASVAAAILCALELAASGVGSPTNIAATLVGHHAWLGLLEGAATAALVAASLQPLVTARRTRFAPALLATVIALVLLPMSSELPDTLEAVLPPSSVVSE